MAAESIHQCPQCGATLQPGTTVCWLCQPYGAPAGTPSGLHYHEPPVPKETIRSMFVGGLTAVVVIASFFAVCGVALFIALIVICGGR